MSDKEKGIWNGGKTNNYNEMIREEKTPVSGMGGVKRIK